MCNVELSFTFGAVSGWYDWTAVFGGTLTAFLAGTVYSIANPPASCEQKVGAVLRDDAPRHPPEPAHRRVGRGAVDVDYLHRVSTQDYVLIIFV